MKNIIALSLLLSSQAFALSSLQATAHFPNYLSKAYDESPALATLASTSFPTVSLELTTNSDMLGKLIVAQDDPALFIGSEGKVKTAALDEAIQIVRAVEVDTQANDAEISSFILSLK